MTTQHAPPSAEKIEEAARDYVFPKERPIGRTYLSLDTMADFSLWDILRDLLEIPALQRLVEIATREKKDTRYLDLLTAYAELLITTRDAVVPLPGVDHVTPFRERVGRDEELINIAMQSLTEAGHAEGLQRFADWRQRRDEALVDEARSYAPGWFKNGSRS